MRPIVLPTLVGPDAPLHSGSPPGIGEAFRNSLGALSAFFTWAVYLITFLLPWALVIGLVVFGVKAVRRGGVRDAG